MPFAPVCVHPARCRNRVPELAYLGAARSATARQQGTLFGVPVQQIAYFPQHPIRAHAGQFSLQYLPFLHAAEPQQLQQPGRPDRSQQLGLYLYSLVRRERSSES